MEVVCRLKPQFTHNHFDCSMMRVLQILISADVNYQTVLDKINQIYNQDSEYDKKKVFKAPELYTLRSICYIYQKNYREAIDQLEKGIKIKEKTLIKESLIEGINREDQRDSKVFAQQMQYNISLCYAWEQQWEKALKLVDEMAIEKDHVAFEGYQKYISLLKGDESFLTGEELPQVQVFPNRNKLSNFLPFIDLPIPGGKKKVLVKPCVPFPKVEPPEIFPTFDDQLLCNFSIESIDRKPEAPWITKQENIITFTGKMQKYSRLQIEESFTTLSGREKQQRKLSESSEEIIKVSDLREPIR